MTGLIYLVIIALWAAVLIPIWLRRHDQISEVRSTARFSSAMRSLGSQGQMQYANTYILDSRDVGLALQGSAAPRSEARMMRPTTDRTARPTEGLNPEYERELVRQAAATRRAVVLGSLTVLLLGSLLLAFISVLPKWAPALAAVPVVAFVIAAAMTSSSRSSAPARRQAPRRERRPAEAAEPVRRPAAMQTDEEWENWNAWDDDSWEAQPTTLPTYVSAPRASAVPRGIDRETPGEWTGEAMVEAARAMRSRPRSEPLADARALDYGAQTAEIPAITDDYPARRAAGE